jgi:hypothetical protein
VAVAATEKVDARGRARKAVTRVVRAFQDFNGTKSRPPALRVAAPRRELRFCTLATWTDHAICS